VTENRKLNDQLYLGLSEQLDGIHDLISVSLDYLGKGFADNEWCVEHQKNYRGTHCTLCLEAINVDESSVIAASYKTADKLLICRKSETFGLLVVVCHSDGSS
jgi:hypothetical protein